MPGTFNCIARKPLTELGVSKLTKTAELLLELLKKYEVDALLVAPESAGGLAIEVILKEFEEGFEEYPEARLH